MLILIRFGDNDFHNVLMAFGELVRTQANPPTLTKAQIVELWNEVSYGLYLVASRGWESGYGAGDNTRKYLKITEAAVFLNEEARTHLDEHMGEANNAWILIDIGNPWGSSCQLI